MYNEEKPAAQVLDFTYQRRVWGCSSDSDRQQWTAMKYFTKGDIYCRIPFQWFTIAAWLLLKHPSKVQIKKSWAKTKRSLTKSQPQQIKSSNSCLSVGSRLMSHTFETLSGWSLQAQLRSSTCNAKMQHKV